MRTRTRLLSVSLALLLPATSALGAEVIKCGPTDPDHKEPGFRFFDHGQKWRATVGVNGSTCSQDIYTFTNSSTNAFAATTPPKVQDLVPLQVLNVPQCKGAVGLGNGGLSGRIDVYCVKVGNDYHRYAGIVIWNTGYYGAIYSVSGADSSTHGEMVFTGVAVDSVAHYPVVNILLTPEKIASSGPVGASEGARRWL